MGVKFRNPILVIILGLITLGIYSLYWFYATSKELIELNKSNSNALFWLIGLFIPFVNLYVFWKYSKAVEQASRGSMNAILVFILSLVFNPIAQYLVQTELNKHATTA
ncbi:MAG: DUF4234 domain-containing protein [Candidatus Micrarchaeota archaeon]|nr:DUF4234 domain-containing protein [Candidatus Micrarchaeota archaeon]